MRPPGNPLLAEWKGPYGGVPDFKSIRIEHFVPGLEAAMQMKRNEIRKIAQNQEPASFENTIVALEKSGEAFARAKTIYDIWSSSLSDTLFEKIESQMEPKLASFKDEITQNKALFNRISAIYNGPELAKLNPEQKRVVEQYYLNFVKDGALVAENNKGRLGEINQKLAQLYTQFSQNQLADEGQFVEIKKQSDLEGLDPSFIESCKSLAESKNLPNSWIVLNTRSSVEPFLTYSKNRNLREQVWRMFIMRGDNGNSNDNKTLITEILQLRAERAKLLGFATHAHWRLSDMMAKKPENAMQLMESVWTPALELVKKEVAQMQAIADAEQAGIPIEAWDYRYYAEKVRKAKYDLDQDEVKKYLQLDRLREGMFWVAGQLFDLEFIPAPEITGFHPDCKVWKVNQKSTKKPVGLWYFDPFARAGKRSGAWMNSHRDQHRLEGKEVLAIVSNNSNFLKGKPGEPVLISWDDAETLFHEFGHALHGLCSQVTYPKLSGTNVAQDYVEFPSQILERWLLTPEVLQKYALHYQSGKAIPEELVKKIKAASAFNQGFSTVEATASALVDMKLHLAGDVKINPAAFEKETLAELKMPKEIVMRHRTPQFGHIFSSDEYSAGYYSYLWSDVISADAWEAFQEASGGAYDRKVASRLKQYVFSAGNTLDQAEAYRKFRGRNAEPGALMRSRGLN